MKYVLKIYLAIDGGLLDVLRLEGLGGLLVGVLGLLWVEGLEGGQGNKTWWETDAGRAEGLYDKRKLTSQVSHFMCQCCDLAL